MKTLACFCALTLAAVASVAALQSDEFGTAAGPLKVTPIMHASVMFEGGNEVVYFDPAQGNYDNLPKADIIAITDIHGDHFQPPIIEKLTKSSTTIIAPAAVAKMLPKAIVLNNGEKVSIGRFDFQAIPMYNLKPDTNGTTYHEKGRGNGYVMTFGNFRTYVAGDTEGTPEMKALKDIDLAFIPMNLPYTMTPQAAAEAVRAFHPRRVYPYHYMGQDPRSFAAQLENTGIDIYLRDWYAK